MKKVLSFLLIFMVSLTLVGISQDVSADAVDVTIYIHVYEHDMDYTNSGTGLWDGANWNSWADTAATTDEFGGVITLPYTAAELAAAGDSFEFKPSSDVTLGDSAPLLAPGEGKVFLDVTALKAGSIDGTMTELHAYYVEGAKDFYIKEVADNGLFLFLYSNPQVAANETIYDGWGLHTWNVGTLGTARPDYWDFPEFDIDVELPAGEYTVPMRLGALEVDSDASNEVGFIVHYGVDAAEEDKSFWGDIMVDVTAIKDGGAAFGYYEHGSETFTADYATFIANTEQGYFDGLKNKFVEGTVITSPTTVEVMFFGTKQPYDLVPSNFMVKDSEGVMVPISGVTSPDTINVGMYESAVTPQAETVVVVYVDTALAHDTLGIAGSMQGWSPENAVVSTVDDANGYAVFEFTSFESEVQFLLLTEDGVDNVDTLDVDEAATLTWDDTKISGDDNLVVDLSAGGVVRVYFNDTDNSIVVNPGTFEDADASMYTYTPTVCAVDENLLTVFVDTEMDHTKLGMVGTVNGWDIGNTIAPIGEVDGVPYFELCMAEADGEFKVLYDTTGDGFAWSNPDDVELVAANTAFAFGDMTYATLKLDYDLAMDLAGYTPVLEPTSIYRLSVYVIGGDAALLGLTGSVTPVNWSPADAVAPMMTDEFGNAIFDLEVTSKTGSFKVLYDMAGETFDWPDSLTDDNFNYDLMANTEGIYVIDMTDMEAVVMTDFGNDLELEGNKTSSFTLDMGANLMFGEMYTVEYIETPMVPAVGEVAEIPAEIISWDLDFETTLQFVEPNVVEESGTYALSPRMIQIEFDMATPLMMANSELALYKGDSMVTLFPEHYSFTNEVGTYESTTVCDDGSSLLYIHFNAMNTEVATLAQLGMVGSIQVAADWDIDNPINPVGMDTEGNYVFEICSPDVDTAVEFKVLYDMSADGFAWSNDDDVELVSGNVAVTVADGPVFYVEEGNSAVNVSKYHSLKIADNFKLDPMSAYTLEFVDGNGFNMFVAIDMDTEAPTVTATVSGADMEINGNATDFDLMDYFTVLSFIDNREGELEYEFVTELDLTTAGEQTITIKAVDMWDNETTYDIMITVIDDTLPVLTIEDAKSYVAGTDAPVWATFATTNEGTIAVDASQVNMATAGVFYVNYTAEDASGNQALGSLEVTITAAEEVTNLDTGCFSSLNAGSSIIILVAALGGAAIFFTRKHR